ncbi:hypothetical protein F4803DRAFT_547605 [Xylaria telfairii]|nr:hypothetical protein F4803DRAFT_547605 [Xylaria telfairii]
MPPTRGEGVKPYRLYVMAYIVGPVCLWAFVIRNDEETLFVDDSLREEGRRYATLD